MKLGVLITYHDERELLTECLESLRAQPALPDQILVYDDASRFPASDYIPASMSVTVIRGETCRGPAYARNRLAEATAADYIHFQDCDDLFLPGWQAGVRERICRKPDLILTELNSSRDGRPYEERLVRLERLRQETDLVGFALRHPILPAVATYRRAFFQQAGGYREDLWQSEDYELHIRMALLRPSYEVCEEPLVHLRVRSESRSQKAVEVWECRWQALQWLAPRVPPAYGNILASAFAETAARLHQLGQEAMARDCFRDAMRWGKPTFENRPAGFRLLAKWLGGAGAERLAAIYRAWVPRFLRKSINP